MFVQDRCQQRGIGADAVDAVIDRFGAIHVCINGAALANGFKVLGKDGKAAPLARFAQITAVNLNGVFNVMSKCAEQMARNDPEAGEERGVVINVSSGAAYEGQIGQSAYAATKAAMIGMNMPAARELGAIGVRVNAIAPGLFLTPMVAALDEKILISLKEQRNRPSAWATCASSRIAAPSSSRTPMSTARPCASTPRRACERSRVKRSVACFMLASEEIKNEIG